MSEPMTLDEAVRVLETATIYARGAEASRAYATIRAHAERTVEARSDEPEAVKRLREAPVWHLVTDYIDTITAERDALVRAIDDAMVSAHIGVFNPGDDPKDAINKLAVYEQGVGEYFVKAERDRLAACVERVKKLPTWDHDPTGDTKKYATMGKMDEAGYTLTEQYAGEWVLRADILAALEDA